MAFRKGLLLVLSALWCVAMIGCLGLHAAAQRDEMPDSASVELPVPIKGTALTAVELVAFEGPFREDGSGREVVDAVGLLLTNSGNELIKKASVCMEQGGRSLGFTVTYLPPGQTALVVEEGAQPYLPGAVSSCYGTESTEMQWIPGVRVEEPGDHRVIVSNNTGQTLSGLRLHFKSWDSSGIFIAGISYSVELEPLPAGATLTLTPFHYVSGYSRVVAVTQE